MHSFANPRRQQRCGHAGYTARYTVLYSVATLQPMSEVNPGAITTSQIRGFDGLARSNQRVFARSSTVMITVPCTQPIDSRALKQQWQQWPWKSSANSRLEQWNSCVMVTRQLACCMRNGSQPTIETRDHLVPKRLYKLRLTALTCL